MYSHHEVDGGSLASVGLHQHAGGLSSSEHEAYVPGNSDGNVRLAPRDERLAVKELRRRHHCKDTRQEEERESLGK